MSRAVTRRDGPAPAARSTAPLAHGLALLEAQRDAMVAGDLGRLAQANAAIDAWAAGMLPLQAAPGGASSPIDERDATRMRGTLRANAAVAQRAASSAQRALAALIPVTTRTYDAGGRPSESTTARTSIQA